MNINNLNKVQYNINQSSTRNQKNISFGQKQADNDEVIVVDNADAIVNTQNTSQPQGLLGRFIGSIVNNVGRLVETTEAVVSTYDTITTAVDNSLDNAQRATDKALYDINRRLPHPVTSVENFFEKQQDRFWGGAAQLFDDTLSPIASQVSNIGILPRFQEPIQHFLEGQIETTTTEIRNQFDRDAMITQSLVNQAPGLVGQELMQELTQVGYDAFQAKHPEVIQGIRDRLVAARTLGEEGDHIVYQVETDPYSYKTAQIIAGLGTLNKRRAVVEGIAGNVMGRQVRRDFPGDEQQAETTKKRITKDVERGLKFFHGSFEEETQDYTRGEAKVASNIIKKQVAQPGVDGTYQIQIRADIAEKRENLAPLEDIYLGMPSLDRHLSQTDDPRQMAGLIVDKEIERQQRYVDQQIKTEAKRIGQEDYTPNLGILDETAYTIGPTLVGYKEAIDTIRKYDPNPVTMQALKTAERINAGLNELNYFNPEYFIAEPQINPESGLTFRTVINTPYGRATQDVVNMTRLALPAAQGVAQPVFTEAELVNGSGVAQPLQGAIPVDGNGLGVMQPLADPWIDGSNQTSNYAGPSQTMFNVPIYSEQQLADPWGTSDEQVVQPLQQVAQTTNTVVQGSSAPKVKTPFGTKRIKL